MTILQTESLGISLLQAPNYDLTTNRLLDLSVKHRSQHILTASKRISCEFVHERPHVIQRSPVWGVPKQRLDGTLNTFILARLSLLIPTPTARSPTCQRSACGEASVPPLLIVHRWLLLGQARPTRFASLRANPVWPHVVQTPNCVSRREGRDGSVNELRSTSHRHSARGALEMLLAPV